MWWISSKKLQQMIMIMVFSSKTYDCYWEKSQVKRNKKCIFFEMLFQTHTWSFVDSKLHLPLQEHQKIREKWSNFGNLIQQKELKQLELILTSRLNTPEKWTCKYL
jgi:hypothetical protein